MPDQVIARLQRIGNYMRNAVAIIHHICFGSPLSLHDALLVDGKPLQAREVRNRGAVVTGACSHVHRQGSAIMRPGGVVACADSATGGDLSVESGRRARVVADALGGADGLDGVPGVPLALDQAFAVGDGLAPLDAGAAAGRGLV